MITLEVEGQLDLRRAFAKLEEKARRRVEQAVKAAGTNINRDVAKALRSGPKSGVTYYRIPGDGYMTVRAGGENGPPVAFIPGSGALNLSPTHRASAKDEAPATDTGTLARSIYYKQDNPLTVTVGASAAYATYLEFGTSRIKPRPAWVPATERERPKFNERIRRILSEEAKL